MSDYRSRVERPRYEHRPSYGYYRDRKSDYRYDGEDRRYNGPPERRVNNGPEYVKVPFKRASQLENGVFLFLSETGCLMYYFNRKQGVIAGEVDNFTVNGSEVVYCAESSVFRTEIVATTNYILQAQEISQEELQGFTHETECLGGHEITVSGSKLELAGQNAAITVTIPIDHTWHYVVNETLMFINDRELCYFTMEKDEPILCGPLYFEAGLLGAVIDRRGQLLVVLDSERSVFFENGW